MWIYVKEKDASLINLLISTLEDHHYHVRYLESDPVVHPNGPTADITLYHNPASSLEKIRLGDVVLDMDNLYAVCDNGDCIRLTPTELAMLQYLMKNAHRAVSRQELLKAIWNMGEGARSRVTDDTAKRLRKKLSGTNLTLETVWNYGFRLISHI